MKKHRQHGKRVDAVEAARTRLMGKVRTAWIEGERTKPTFGHVEKQGRIYALTARMGDTNLEEIV